MAIISIENPNPIGRDFVVGDIHGCVEPLLDGLKCLEFNPLRDRLFCLGDLIDRGPESLRALRLLREPWFFAVRGNHEDMLLSAFHRFNSVLHGPSAFYQNGGEWVRSLNDEELEELRSLLTLVEKLPYIRTFAQSGEVLFHLTHAELLKAEFSGESLSTVSCSMFLNDEQLLDWGLNGGFPPKSFNTPRLKAVSTWGRRVLRDFNLNSSDPQMVELQGEAGLSMTEVLVSEDPFAKNLSLTLVGHSVVELPILHFSHLFLDGGLVRRDVCKGELFIVDALEIYHWANSNFPSN